MPGQIWHECFFNPWTGATFFSRFTGEHAADVEHETRVTREYIFSAPSHVARVSRSTSAFVLAWNTKKNIALVLQAMHWLVAKEVKRNTGGIDYAKELKCSPYYLGPVRVNANCRFRAERNVNRLLFNFFRQKPITCLQLLTGIAKEEKKKKKAVTNLTNLAE